MFEIPLPQLQQCWFLAGPTASGKSAVAMELARRIDAEIIALDSMTIYRYMDIGTAKPSLEDQKEIPHHLLDIVHPHDDFSVSQYIEAAKVAVNDIQSRGKIALFVGGTGLYLRSILRGVFSGPDANWELRNELEELARVQGPEIVHERLQQIDPESARKYHFNDVRRVVRAIEVFEETGTPLSQQQQQPPLPLEQRPKHIHWIFPPRKWLYDRVNLRVLQMLEEGLEQEVRNLMELTPPLGRTARQALGYKEIIDAIEAKQPSLDPAIEQIQIRTRQFAKRQHTFCRNIEEAIPLQTKGTESASELADRILASETEAN